MANQGQLADQNSTARRGATHHGVDGAGDRRSTDRRRATKTRAIEFAAAYALVGLISVMAIFFSSWGKTAGLFPTSSNIKVLVAQQAVIAVVAMGALIPLVAGEWDLSIGANAGLTSVFVASALSSGWSVPAALLLGIGI